MGTHAGRGGEREGQGRTSPISKALSVVTPFTLTNKLSVSPYTTSAPH